MKLCLDCGNTRIKWGLRDDNAWRATGAVPSARPIELLAALTPYPDPDAVVASNVAGPKVETALGVLFPQGVRWILAGESAGDVRNGYATPHHLGADRWAALVGARALHEGPCLVVNAGTATTIDLLHGDGRFPGGLILPGLGLMRRSLAQGTAQLPDTQGAYAAVPDNTRDAISSGALHATLGAIERMARALAHRDSGAPFCLLSGGNAELLAPHLELPHRIETHLVLHGLARLAP